MRLETRMGTLSFERSTRPTIRHRSYDEMDLSNALAVFVICCTSRAIAQTTTNQPPASSAQGATPSSAPAQSLEQEINSEVAEAGNGKASLTEVNKELSNPISTIWALSFQQNTFWLNKPERNVVNILFQPVLPVSLTSNWNLITPAGDPGLQLNSLRKQERQSSSRNRIRRYRIGGTAFAGSEVSRPVAGRRGSNFHFPDRQQFAAWSKQVANWTYWTTWIPRREVDRWVCFPSSGGRSAARARTR